MMMLWICTVERKLKYFLGLGSKGKTTIGMELAKALDLNFLDADSLHPSTNIGKMKAGAY